MPCFALRWGNTWEDAKHQQMIQLSRDVSRPAIGQGTWNMGEDASQRKTEFAALRAGIELGVTLIDTAEM